MKILIAYDGTANAFTAVHELRRAGLPTDVDALVVSVVDARPEFLGATAAVQDVRLAAVEGEITGPTPTRLAWTGAYRPRDPFPPWFRNSGPTTEFVGPLGLRDASRHPSKQVTAARLHVASVVRLLGRWFPQWTVRGRVCAGDPFLALMAQADDWRPDLVVTGTRDHLPAPSETPRASLSHSLLHALDCSVRVARPRRQSPDAPLRLIVAHDGSDAATVTTRSVAARSWPPDTEVRLVPVVARFNWRAPRAADDHRAAQWLRASGLRVTCASDVGPFRALADRAAAWRADCLFLDGARVEAWSHPLRRDAIPTSAHALPCTVEVVRPNRSSRGSLTSTAGAIPRLANC